MEDEKLEYIYRRYRRLVMEQAYSILGDYFLAQDICQEVFIRLSPNRMELINGPNDDMARYLKVAAHNRAVDYYRERCKRGEVSLEAKRNLSESDIVDKIVRMDFEIEIFDALRKKNEEWYQIILRLGFYDEPQEIVARDLGISPNLLRTKYHRAKQWIRKNYESGYEMLKDF